MGQQQLLLVILAIIIVGVAVALSITLFRQNAIDSKRDLLLNECISIANMAQAYFKKPEMLGGGGNSFAGWSIPSEMEVTATGWFAAEIEDDKIIIIGTGNEIATGTDTTKIKLTVFPKTFSTEIIN